MPAFEFKKEPISQAKAERLLAALDRCRQRSLCRHVYYDGEHQDALGVLATYEVKNMPPGQVTNDILEHLGFSLGERMSVWAINDGTDLTESPANRYLRVRNTITAQIKGVEPTVPAQDISVQPAVAAPESTPTSRPAKRRPRRKPHAGQQEFAIPLELAG